MNDQYVQLANAIRCLSLDAIERAKSGHIGICLGMADVVTVLFKDFLKFYSKEPTWDDRDRFVLSAGHGSMLLYSLLYLTGYEDISIDDLKNFRQLGSKTAGHPEHDLLKGVEVTTGPLGQGLANAVGMALAERITSSRFPQLAEHRTYALVSDGDLMEGISQEAISFAGHQKLNNLIVLFDNNKITIDGETSLTISDDMVKRFEACNWNVLEVDGHDHAAIRIELSKAQNATKPSLIICNTVIGFGAKDAGKSCMHSAVLSKDDVEFVKTKLGCKYTEFEISQEILAAWRDIGRAHKKTFEEWQSKLNAHKDKAEFLRAQGGEIPREIDDLFLNIKKEILDKKKEEATRASSGYVLEKLCEHLPELIGGSADLTESNLTKTPVMNMLSPANHAGRYIYYGIREHAMAAIMNGMALHGGVIPYGGTFLTFSDYCRPAIRLAALMKQRVIYIFTHDSIGVGEDGPTHQPIEHLDSLRLIPNLLVLRPCDAYETAECFEVALKHEGPSALCLTRQKLPLLSNKLVEENHSSYGAYIISREKKEDLPYCALIASGSEVEIALQAQQELDLQGINTRVISAPCITLFYQQGKNYQNKILGSPSNIIAIEASTALSYAKITSNIMSINTFGASGKYQDLFKHFGITKERIIAEVVSL